MIFETLPVGPLQCNCRIIVCPKTFEAAVVDPGDEADTILNSLKAIEQKHQRKLNVKFLFHTHAHFDHFGATADVKRGLTPEAKIALHQDEEQLYQALQMQGQMFGFGFKEPLPIDTFLEHEQEIRLGELKISLIHTPGHSPGGLCYRIHEDTGLKSKERVLSGDTLFFESVGRTDLWGGDSDTLVSSIKERLFVLDDDTEVCPGHGPDSKIGHEKRKNSFLR